MPGRLRRYLLALFATGILLVAVFGLFTAVPLPHKPILWIANDRLLHVIGFASLAMFGLLLWGPAPAMVLLLIAGAGALELLQHFFPAHQTSLGDWAASSSGVVLGSIIFLALRAGLARRLATAPDE